MCYLYHIRTTCIPLVFGRVKWFEYCLLKIPDQSECMTGIFRDGRFRHGNAGHAQRDGATEPVKHPKDIQWTGKNTNAFVFQKTQNFKTVQKMGGVIGSDLFDDDGIQPGQIDAFKPDLFMG